MPEPSPIFSVIIPTYNRANLIGKAIESVLQQEFENFEVLVVDDGSEDQTEQVVMGFADARLHYHRKENGERGAARNYGAARAKGLYLNFFDSDDLLYPNHLRVANKLISDLKNPEFLHLAYDLKLENGRQVNNVNDFNITIHDVILFNNKLSCNGVFLRKDIALQFPFEEDRVMASSEDWELWIRLLSRFKLHFSNEITSSVINHGLRSLRTIPTEKIVSRDLLFIEKLRQDEAVILRYGQSFKRFVAERYTFFMLCFAEQKQPGEVLKWGIRACRIYPVILSSRRFLASIKNIILK